MPIIRLPDGSERQFDSAVTVAQVAESIGAGLARAALAGKVNGRLVDTSFEIDDDVELAIVTAKDEAGLEVLRHSCAHLLAQAVKQLYPLAQVTIGPVIEDGFYYDFAYEPGFTPDDLQAIEERMLALAKQDIKVERSVMARDEAIEFFRSMGEEYKAKIIEDIPQGETLSLYRQGDFIDLCRGPHIPNTGKLKAFKLTKLSGAYWRGDAKNQMLQRIYGTAWSDKEALDAYLFRIAEAEKRDHRKIGRELDLFHFQPEAPGMCFWHSKGWQIYLTIEAYLRNKLKKHGYIEVKTPQILTKQLWETSGHLAKFSEEMFITAYEDHEFAVKPMNCPGHLQIFNNDLRSYRDLPIRMAEFGCCHRKEPSGALHGLMRVRGFTQDDAHIFCAQDQVQQETKNFIKLLREVYQDFGFSEILVKLSTRPENRIGSDELWDKAEKALADALDSQGLDWRYNPGEGAFYGPKIEFTLKDCLGRLWQCGTIQLDYSMPERFGASYIAQDNNRQTPVMLHRAIFGSFERFIAILIENFAGKFPVWLAPIQVMVMGISSKQDEYVQEITKTLQNNGFRADLDLRNEKIGYRIRQHILQRIPYQVVLGDREVETRQVSVRTLAGEDLGSMSINDFISRLTDQVNSRSLEN